MNKKVVEMPHSPSRRGGPDLHERFQKDGTKGESSSSSGFLTHDNGGCCGPDQYVCDCPCHDPANETVHCSPCCEKSLCGLQIKIGATQLHINQCEKCKSIRSQASFWPV
jgi:hypothetical protein